MAKSTKCKIRLHGLTREILTSEFDSISKAKEWVRECWNRPYTIVTTIAKDEFDITRVLNLLDKKEKIARVKTFYSIDEIEEILGFGDGSVDDEDVIFVDEYVGGRDEAICLLAIKNGNFEEVIARNAFLPI
jgi:hypothetical protein